MPDVYTDLDEATAALATTAERAAILIRTESVRAKEEAARTRREIDDIRTEIRSARAEFESVRSTIRRDDGEKDRIRRSAGWAWSAVGLMAACVTVAVGWTATQLTRANEVANTLNDQVAQMRLTLDQRDSQLASLRWELGEARSAEAKAQAQFEALVQESELPPPQPLVNMFGPLGPEVAGESLVSTTE